MTDRERENVETAGRRMPERLPECGTAENAVKAESCPERNGTYI